LEVVSLFLEKKANADNVDALKKKVKALEDDVQREISNLSVGYCDPKGRIYFTKDYLSGLREFIDKLSEYQQNPENQKKKELQQYAMAYGEDIYKLIDFMSSTGGCSVQ
jgi:hypothetical protein